eukprot:TRINITY_DN2961_c0_g1_i1.p1 TRINITY_DN2961_c0_g1~~TRINITY_DN2961_c0_g1_i1.p1  ORF type:complete len:588 (+),score=231.99 TRINITY_DN2961_c0_g1_i1:140-1903(+)
MISRNPWDAFNAIDKKNEGNLQKNTGNQSSQSISSSNKKKSGQKGRDNQQNMAEKSNNSSTKSKNSNSYDAPWMWESWTAQPEPEWEEVSNKKKGKNSDFSEDLSDFSEKGGRNPVGDVEPDSFSSSSNNSALTRAQKKNMKKKLKKTQNSGGDVAENDEESEDSDNPTSYSSSAPSNPPKEVSNISLNPSKPVLESSGNVLTQQVQSQNSSTISSEINKEDEFVDPKNVVKKTTEPNASKSVNSSNSFSLLEQQFPSLPRSSGPPPSLPTPNSSSNSTVNSQKKKQESSSPAVKTLNASLPKVEENKSVLNSNGLLSDEEIKRNREEEMRILRELEEKKKKIEELRRLEEMHRQQQQQTVVNEENQYQFHPFFHNNPMQNLHPQQFFPFDSPMHQQQQEQIEYQRQTLQQHQPHNPPHHSLHHNHHQQSPFFSQPNPMGSLENSMENFGISSNPNPTSHFNSPYSSNFQTEQDYINSLIGLNELTSAPGLNGSSPRRNVPPGFNSGNTGLDSGFPNRNMPPGLESNGRGGMPPGFGVSLRTSGGNPPGFSSPARGNAYNPNHVYPDYSSPFGFDGMEREEELDHLM